MLTQEQLRSVMEYSPETGEFWSLRRGRKIIGTLRPDGYVGLRILGVQYLAHRMAFFYMTGRWPTHIVDHIDFVKNNNRWLNLREATDSQNMMNRRPREGRLRGVRYRPKYGTYRARIGKDGKSINLGSFATEDEALAARRAAAESLFGEFAGAME